MNTQDENGAAPDPVRSMLLSLLAAAIRNRPPGEGRPLDPGGWDRLSARARDLDILPLLYPAVSRLPPEAGLPPDRRAAWRKTAMQAGMQEERRYREALTAAGALAARGIRCVAFKGLVLRDLYPRPELRTMGDVDLLVKPGDLAEAGDAFRALQLRCVAINGCHRSWSSGPGSLIEVHSALADDPLPGLERAFLERAAPHPVPGGMLLAPDPEDAAVYQVFHMAKHIRYLGSGVRELADLTLQLERGVDPDRWYERLEKEGLGRFALALASLCRRDLGLESALPSSRGAEVPAVLLRRLGDELTEPGRDNLERMLALTANRQGNGRGWRLPFILAFPPPGRMGARYAYSRNRPWLLGLAWLHRFAVSAAGAPVSLARTARFVWRRLAGRDSRMQLLAGIGLADQPAPGSRERTSAAMSHKNGDTLRKEPVSACRRPGQTEQ